MDKKELLKEINVLEENYKRIPGEDEYIIIEQMEKIFDDYLKMNPYDAEIWIKLAFIVYESPLHDLMKTIHCLETVLKFDPNNCSAALFLGYVYEFSSGIHDEFFNQLCILEPENNELASMIEYEKYFYYRSKDVDLIEESLLKSIKLCDKYVWNNIDLGRFYISKKQAEKAKKYIKNGFNNIQYVYQPGDFKNGKFNPFDLEEFFNERLKGIHLSWVNYDILKEDFDYVESL